MEPIESQLFNKIAAATLKKQTNNSQLFTLPFLLCADIAPISLIPNTAVLYILLYITKTSQHLAIYLPFGKSVFR